MPDPHLQAIAEAFSRKALVYDAFGEDHPNLARMRRRVREHVLAFLRPGERMLELNAGTGGDAAYFAGLGCRVHATDLAPGMIVQVEAKIAAGGLENCLTAECCGFDALDRLPAAAFDYVFSNMGGVNCTADLAGLAQAVARRLAPGGRVTWVVMPPVCPWELARALGGNFPLALRRLRPGGVLAHVDGIYFRTWYYPPGAVRRAFGASFRLACLQGLAVFTPPADHKAFPFHHPRLYRALCRLDDALEGRYPFNRMGDFYMITLVRR